LFVCRVNSSKVLSGSCSEDVNGSNPVHRETVSRAVAIILPHVTSPHSGVCALAMRLLGDKLTAWNASFSGCRVVSKVVADVCTLKIHSVDSSKTSVPTYAASQHSRTYKYRNEMLLIRD
jgi:hypothetical protein